jgi:hypothetical protein
LRKRRHGFPKSWKQTSALFPSLSQIPSIKQSTLEIFQVALKLPFHSCKSFFICGGIS